MMHPSEIKKPTIFSSGVFASINENGITETLIV
jgi:hypothetical protein